MRWVKVMGSKLTLAGPQRRAMTMEQKEAIISSREKGPIEVWKRQRRSDEELEDQESPEADYCIDM